MKLYHHDLLGFRGTAMSNGWQSALSSGRGLSSGLGLFRKSTAHPSNLPKVKKRLKRVQIPVQEPAIT